MYLMDSKLFEILKNSFLLLWRRPSIFIPKIFSSAVGAIWFIGFLENIGPKWVYIISYPVMVVMAVAVSVLVSAFVKQDTEKRDISFRRGLNKLWKSKFQVLITSFILTLVVFAISLPFALGFASYILFRSYIPFIIGFLITIVFTLIFAIAIYFLPAALVSESSSIKSFKQSIGSANENRRHVLILTVFSFLLLLVASVSTGRTRNVGYAGFIIGRLLSAVFSTYIYVVSPKYYFEN